MANLKLNNAVMASIVTFLSMVDALPHGGPIQYPTTSAEINTLVKPFPRPTATAEESNTRVKPFPLPTIQASLPYDDGH